MKIILKMCLVLLMLAVSSIAASSDLDKADALYDKGRYQEALSIYLNHPDNPLVQNRIGTIYMEPGLKNERIAIEWFQKAADQNNLDALFNLAMLYRQGSGIPQNYAQAFLLYKKAADLGLSDAMNSIGVMYEQGLGVKRSKNEAEKWFTKAANEGNSRGQCNLAGYYIHGNAGTKDYEKALKLLNECLKNDTKNICCLNRMAESFSFGWGVKKDIPKSLKYYQLAADQGDVRAMYNIANIYDYGYSGLKDPKQAIDWYTKAAAKNEAMAMHRLYEVYEHGKLGQPVDKVKAAEWKARAEKAMKDQGVSRNAWVDAFRLLMED